MASLDQLKTWARQELTRLAPFYEAEELVNIM